MAIPKKGSRKITVDGIAYRWRVRHKPTYDQDIFESSITASVELYESPNSYLLIVFPWTRCDAGIRRSDKPITPKLIEISIKRALSNGWNPSKNQSFEYYFEESNALES